MNSVYHIALTKDLDAARNAAGEADLYRCASLSQEGFIHCCTRLQLGGVIERYYSTVENVCLLLIDVEKLSARIVYENTVGGEEQFPHIYGGIDDAAIARVWSFGVSERQGIIAGLSD